MNTNKHYFITVNFNNYKYTIDYVNSIKKNRRNSVIIIVDNNSKNIDRIELNHIYSEDKEVVLVYNEENIGYFKALNVGLDRIIDRDSHVIIGNNDLVFNEDFLNKLESLELSDDILAIAPNIITLDGVHQNPHVLKRFSKLVKFFHRAYFSNYFIGQLIFKLSDFYKSKKRMRDKKGNNTSKEIFMGYGACYILTPAFFKHYNCLDAPVFLMGEEAIFSNQIHKAKGKVYYFPELKLTHKDHASIGRMPTKTLYKISQKSFKIYSKYL